jgi:hypothetical protein
MIIGYPGPGGGTVTTEAVRPELEFKPPLSQAAAPA